MDAYLLLQVFILGVVEGLTEFLPISSTGHLILAGHLLQFTGERAKLFEIVIQSGAMFAVCWEYRVKLHSVVSGLTSQASAQRFVVNLVIAFLPAALLGLLFHRAIKEHLFAPVPVAMAFIIGGLIILWVERRAHTVTIQSVDELRWQDALKLGLAQSLALIPGTSRSGATIIGGLFFGLSRKAATEFSFFLAIPTLFAATIYEGYKGRELFVASDLGMWVVGFACAFISAFLCVRWLLRYISAHSFAVFAYYRIAFGLFILLTAYFGWVPWAA